MSARSEAKHVWPAREMSQPSVLVAGPGQATRVRIAGTFLRAGFTVSEARNDHELVEIAAAAVREDGAPFDVLVIDVSESGPDELSALGKLREALRPPFVVAIIRDGDVDARHAARAFGAAAVYEGGASPRDLGAVARVAVGRR